MPLKKAISELLNINIECIKISILIICDNDLLYFIRKYTGYGYWMNVILMKYMINVYILK